MAFNVNAWREPTAGRPPERSGIYWATSADAMRWSEPVKLVTDYSYPMLGKSMSWEATVVFNDHEGRTGWLVYSHSPSWLDGKGGGIPHFMVGRRIELQRSEQ